MARVVTRVAEIADKARDRIIMVDTMRAILAISRTAHAEEDMALSSAVPVVIDMARRQPDIIEAISAIPLLVYVRRLLSAYLCLTSFKFETWPSHHSKYIFYCGRLHIRV